MKGFVPVNKASMLSMLADCRQALDSQVESETQNRINRFVKAERERMTIRRWYRPFMLPNARFAFDDDSVVAYANSLDYPVFDGSPFLKIKEDARHSLVWIDKLERVAMSEHSGEPIQLDMKTFMRISEPAAYHWATVGICYSIVY